MEQTALKTYRSNAVIREIQLFEAEVVRENLSKH